MRALALACLPACFGGGPEVSRPADATLVFGVPTPPPDMECGSMSTYIGSVAIHAGMGIATTLPYEGPGCDSSSPIGPIQVPVFAFDTDGASTSGSMLGTAGQSDGSTRARVTFGGGVPTWAFEDTGSSISIQARDGGAIPIPGFASIDTAGLVSDGTTIYLAGWLTQNGSGDPNNPDFPNNQQEPAFALAPSLNGMPTYSLTSVPVGGGAPTSLPMQAVFCELMKDCLVDNATTLFAMTRADPPHVATLASIDKATATVTEVDTIEAGLANDVGPVGLAADDTRVVWTAAVDPRRGAGCFVFDHPLGGTTSMVFSSTAFSCRDAALDADAIYFAIISIDDSGQLHGDGIGRVALADGTFDSVATGFVASGAGPRRIYVDGDDLYAVDPLAIGKIPKAAITGQDF